MSLLLLYNWDVYEEVIEKPHPGGRGRVPGPGERHLNAPRDLPVKLKQIVTAIDEVADEIAEPSTRPEGENILENLQALREAQQKELEYQAYLAALEEEERLRQEALDEEAALEIILAVAKKMHRAKGFLLRIR